MAAADREVEFAQGLAEEAEAESAALRARLTAREKIHEQTIEDLRARAEAAEARLVQQEAQWAAVESQKKQRAEAMIEDIWRRKLTAQDPPPRVGDIPHQSEHDVTPKLEQRHEPAQERAPPLPSPEAEADATAGGEDVGVAQTQSAAAPTESLPEPTPDGHTADTVGTEEPAPAEAFPFRSARPIVGPLDWEQPSPRAMALEMD